MTARAKFLIGFLAVALAVGAIAFFQERRQQSILEAVRGSLVVGDSKEKVERVMRERGLLPAISKDGQTYTAHVWFHFRPDVSVIVVLDEQRQVAKVFTEDYLE